ncbi:uncharacterized protein LOC135810951 [Sycon ciliatum]|uniref:uncharacterized protein LOC135810951 n=1 Tax=Sycon ciliatum TaxID=27933 RepID=UPI0031F65F06
MSLPNPVKDQALLRNLDNSVQNAFWLGYSPDSSRFELINRFGKSSTQHLVSDLVPASTSTVLCTSFYRRCHFDTDCATYQTCVDFGTLKVCLTEHATCKKQSSSWIGLGFGYFTYPEAASKCRQLNYDLVPEELYNPNINCVAQMARRMLIKQPTKHSEIAIWFTPMYTHTVYSNFKLFKHKGLADTSKSNNVQRREVAIICSKPL